MQRLEAFDDVIREQPPAGPDGEAVALQKPKADHRGTDRGIFPSLPTRVPVETCMPLAAENRRVIVV